MEKTGTMLDKDAVLKRLDVEAFYRAQGVHFVGQSNSQGELKAHCPFGAHEDRNPSASFNINPPGLYKCHGCGHEGDVFTFCKVMHGEEFSEALKRLADFAGLTDGASKPTLPPKRKPKPSVEPELVSLEQSEAWVETFLHDEQRLRELEETYGLSRQTVANHHIGFDGSYFTIPLPTTLNDGKLAVKRHRRGQQPKARHPANVPAQLYGAETLKDAPNGSLVIVTGGELKRLLLVQWGFLLAGSGTAGEGTFLPEWADYFRGKDFEVVILYDVDGKSEVGIQKVECLLYPVAKTLRVVRLPLSGRVDEKDINDYARLGHTADDLRRLIASTEPIPTPEVRFPPLGADELSDILGRTIKRDEANKLVTFLCSLLAYTEDAQFNVINNAPSSTGKSYIPMEVTALFPSEDVLAVAYCSPTAFFHDAGQFVKEIQGYIVDLSRKILVFLDQPHTLLLQHLRPMLSHDKKELRLKITDKSQKAGLRTKNIYLRGYPAVMFCTSNLKIDEQEATRALLLSPEIHQEKIREAIRQKIERETDARAFTERLEADPRRQLLKDRIAAIKGVGITHINIPAAHRIETRFFQGRSVLKPRHMRDIGRVMALIKGWALLNLWHRKRNGSVIEANETDITDGFRMWEPVAESQEYNLPPYLYQLFQEVIVPAYRAKGDSVSRQEVLQQHYKVYHRFLPDYQLRQQVIPMLETAGLITQEPDQNDRRRMLIRPIWGNSESDGGGEAGISDGGK